MLYIKQQIFEVFNRKKKIDNETENIFIETNLR